MQQTSSADALTEEFLIYKSPQSPGSAARAHEHVAPVDQDARAWARILANYREPSGLRSVTELLITLVPFVALWALSWWALSVSYLLASALAILNSAFLVRLFMIQHDCGHGSFFRSRALSDWLGRFLAVLTLTPYDVWRRTHSVHHASAGNLDKRGMGDVLTLTVAEYRDLSAFGRLRYRLYRHQLVLFGLGPTYLFIFQNRLPWGLMRSGWRYWVSAMATNMAVALLVGAITYAGGAAAILFVFLPTTIVAASIGVWLFYVQHQFEETSWDPDPDWQLHNAALHGSSHYVLPGALRLFTANIGAHHVHHLQSRVPFYRLSEVLRDHPDWTRRSVSLSPTVCDGRACNSGTTATGASFHLRRSGWAGTERRASAWWEAFSHIIPFPADQIGADRFDHL